MKYFKNIWRYRNKRAFKIAETIIDELKKRGFEIELNNRTHSAKVIILWVMKGNEDYQLVIERSNPIPCYMYKGRDLAYAITSLKPFVMLEYF